VKGLTNTNGSRDDLDTVQNKPRRRLFTIWCFTLFVWLARSIS